MKKLFLFFSILICYRLSGQTITTGTVSVVPFILTDCSDTETGTVSFTSTGTFNPGNIYTAQLSDDLGLFNSPINIGSITDNSNAGIIPITIPAGTCPGTDYKIRVVSDNPAVIGSESAFFTIIQQGLGGCTSSHYDYYQSVQSGAWHDLNTWQSSNDGVNWVTATLTPTFLANSIEINAPDSVYINASVTIDQVLIYGGAVLHHVSGVLTVEDNINYDIDNNGMLMLSVTGGPVMGTGNPAINIATGGILRVAASGMTGAGTGVNSNNYIYNNNSILEYTLIGAFSTNNVTYFPNVAPNEIPIFRVTANNPTVMIVGSNNPTTFNGLFQITGTATVRWQNSGNRFFRNGIENVGPMDFEALSIGSSLFHINGSTAILGGSGSLIVPNAGLQIASGTIVDMSSDKAITGSISLLNTNSRIVLGVSDLTVTGNVTITDSSSFVKTNSSGTLTLNSVNGIGKLFPIGYSSINPLYIQSPNSTTDYSARVVEPITPPIYNDNRAVLCTWNISSTAGGTGVLIAFGYAYPSDAGPLYNNSGPVEAGVNVGMTWSIHQTGLFPTPFPIVNGTYVVGVSGVNHMNGPTNEFPFVIANIGAILASDYFIVCRAQKQNGNAVINWKVRDVDNVNGFEVERSVNGGNYQTIALVSPSSNQTDYSYTDDPLPKGILLYKIKVNRNNGAPKFSNTVAIINDSHGLLITSILPNPVKNNAEIILSSAKPTRVKFTVNDISGRPVKEWHSNLNEGTNYVHADLSSLTAGVYHLLASTLETKIVVRFVKQ